MNAPVCVVKPAKPENVIKGIVQVTVLRHSVIDLHPAHRTNSCPCHRADVGNTQSVINRSVIQGYPPPRLAQDRSGHVNIKIRDIHPCWSEGHSGAEWRQTRLTLG